MRALWGVVALALVASAPLLQHQLAAQPRSERAQERLYYPDGAHLHAASLGFSAPAADYLWLQTTQYYGAYRCGEHDLQYFDGLVAAVTQLDPRFVDAYVFYSLVLCMDTGEYDHAVDQLKRGILANPGDWQLPFNVGFIYYVFEHRYDEASMWFEHAASLDGASDFCRRFAAFAKRRSGDRRGSLLLWQELRRTTDSPDMRALADTMIGKLQGEMQNDGLPQHAPSNPAKAGL